MNIKLVRFKNGMYGIRNGLFFYKYYDFFIARKDEKFSWERGCLRLWHKHGSYYFSDCMVDEVSARKELQKLKGELVDKVIE